MDGNVQSGHSHSWQLMLALGWEFSWLTTKALTCLLIRFGLLITWLLVQRGNIPGARVPRDKKEKLPGHYGLHPKLTKASLQPYFIRQNSNRAH